MKKDKTLGARVERFLSPECQPEDLTQIFLSLRQESYGNECVKEVGDFVAHRKEREKGITTQRVRDYFTMLPVMQTGGQQLDISNLPPDIIDFLDAAFRMYGIEFLHEKTGLNTGRAKRAFLQFRSKIKPIGGGKIGIKEYITAEEQLVANCLTNRSLLIPAFDDDKLIQELLRVLKIHELISAADINSVLSKKHLVAAYVISVMHQSKIIQLPADAEINGAIYKGTLAAFAMSSRQLFQYSEIAAKSPVFKPIGFPIFKTSAPAEKFCDASLIGDPRLTFWECPIELSASLVLSPLNGEPPS